MNDYNIFHSEADSRSIADIPDLNACSALENSHRFAGAFGKQH
jgi:hypothetical protein